jgi:type I restriction enzyme S subunit
MDAQQFLAEFGHIANAPNGVARLRELILALAVQGRLVEQLESAEPAEVQVEKIRHIASGVPIIGRRKKANALAANSFLPTIEGTLPKGWTNVPLCDLVRVLNGRAYSKSELLDAGTPVLRVGNLFTSEKWYYSNIELEDDKYCDNGDLLYAWSASFGPFIWGGEKVIYHYHIWKLDLFSNRELNKHYLYTYLLEKTQEIKAAGHGISMAHMTKEKFEQLSVLLPPLEEQSRIVAKVDELMALCDKLEAQQQNRRKLQNKLRQSILQSVANANNPNELQSAWARLADNFGMLFDKPADARELRDLVFDLALRGAFLPETAEKATGGSLYEDKPTLPHGWEWKTLAELSEYITSGSRGWKAYLASSGDAFIRSQDIKHDELIFENPAFVALPDKAEGKRTLVQQGDLLLTITGGNVGKCATVPALPYKAYVSQHVALIRLHDPSLSNIIHFWMINAYGGRQFLSRYIYGDKPGLNLTQVGSVLIPVPPEAVRTQIFDNLHSYKIMCDRLADQIRAKKSLATALATVAIASFTGKASEQGEQQYSQLPQRNTTV